MNLQQPIDLFDPAVQEDWYPTYRTLLEEARLSNPHTDIYVLSKYEDILTL